MRDLNVLAGYLGNYSRYEIERKFLLKQLPISLPESYVDIHDLYLENSSLRLRTERSSAGEIIGRKLTKKDKSPDNGCETSIITSLYLSEGDVLALGQLKGASLNKRRFIHQCSNQRIVYDVFQGALSGLIMAEIEFQDHEALMNYELEFNEWEEVTGNPKYSGGALAFST